MDEPIEDSDFASFRSCYLFRGMAKETVQSLFLASQKVILNKDEYLFRENEEGQDFFILISGTLIATKLNHEIGYILPGNSIGEVSLLDEEPRSASILALTRSELRKIPFEQLRLFLKKQPDPLSNFFRLAGNIGQRLRQTNDLVIHSIEAELDQFKIRTKGGYFIILTVSILSLFSYLSSFLNHMIKTRNITSYVTLPLSVFFALICVIISTKVLQMPIRKMGINTTNIKKSIFEGIVYSILALIGFIFIKFIFVHYNIIKFHSDFFDIFHFSLDPAYRNWEYWVLVHLIYWILVIPSQEIVVRGGLQGYLETFLVGKRAGLFSILASNLIFGMIHTIYSLNLAIAAWCLGVYLGWLYHRSHNLAGCCLGHIILATGVFMLFHDLL